MTLKLGLIFRVKFSFGLSPTLFISMISIRLKIILDYSIIILQTKPELNGSHAMPLPL